MSDNKKLREFSNSSRYCNKWNNKILKENDPRLIMEMQKRIKSKQQVDMRVNQNKCDCTKIIVHRD